MYKREIHSWLILTILCVFVITGPQPTEAAPSLASYVMVTSGSYYIQLTFTEPVTINDKTALILYGNFTNSSDPLNVVYMDTTCRASSTLVLTPSIGYSPYMRINLGTKLDCSFPDGPGRTYSLSSISLDTGFAATEDNISSLAFSESPPNRTFSSTDNIAPTLSSFSYNVSSGVVKFSFSPHFMFTSLNTTGITLTNNSGMTIPLAPVSYSPDPSVAAYTGVQLTLPVDTIVTLATSPWMGASVSLLNVTIPAAAVTNFLGNASVGPVTIPVTTLTRDCYNRSTYYNAPTGDCQPCDPTCLTCKGPLLYPDTISGCTDCSVVLVTGQTSYQCHRGTTCPDGYYRSNSTASSPVTTPGSILCLPCNASCFQCFNSSTCTSCAALLPIQPTLLPIQPTLLPSQSTLLPIQPAQCCDNTTGACQSCNSSCMGGCRGPLNTDCVYCRELKYIRNGTVYCLSTCPPHTFQRGVLCLTCTSSVSDVICPPDHCWLGFEYNRDTYVCQLTKQFRYIVIPATAGGGGLLVVMSFVLCFLCWLCPTVGRRDTSNKRAYNNPTFSPEAKSAVNPLLT